MGDDLRIEGNSADYHSMAVHPEDVEELAKRIEMSRRLRQGVATDDDNLHFVTPEERREAEEFLTSRGLPRP